MEIGTAGSWIEPRLGEDDERQRASAIDRTARVRAARWAGRAALVAAAYYGSAKLGYVVQFSGPVAAIVWLPAGVGIAALSLGGLALWPGVLAGDLAANAYASLTVGPALAQTVGNMLEVVAAAAAIRLLARRTDPLGRTGAAAGVVGILAAATAASATVGVLSLGVGGVLANGLLVTTWRTWWLGDFAGALLVVPLVLAWARRGASARDMWPLASAARRVEAAVMLAAVGVCAWVGSSTDPLLTYLMLPPLVWAAARFGARGATLALALSVALTVWNTTHDVGPFRYESVGHSVLAVQLYVVVAAVTIVLLAVAVAERDTLAERTATLRVQMSLVATAERHRLERNLHDGAQQRLAALAVHVALARQDADLPASTRGLLGSTEGELYAAIDELRALAHGLHPAALTELGLAGAIGALAERSQVPVRLVALPAERLDEAVETDAYYVVAELLANVLKHAHASSIAIRAEVVGGRLELEVVDDGVGGAFAEGAGLRGVLARVEEAGGRFALESRRGGGTRALATVPAVRR